VTAPSPTAGPAATSADAPAGADAAGSLGALGEVGGMLRAYFDGLHTSDAGLLAEVFDPAAIYATAADGSLLTYDMATYLPIVAARQSPAARGEARRDRVLAVDLVGPVTALAKVECAIGERFFTDLLTLVRVDGRWRVIAKVFHYEVEEAATCRTSA
jgi:hypothetical protein